MAHTRGHLLLRYLRHLTVADVARDTTDDVLLARFATDQDEAAFAGLMQRHAPMVFGVCARVLGNLHDAEDALQATFCVLASRARSLRQPAQLGNWLYGVAHRTALKAKTEAARRRAREGRVKAPAIADPADEVARHDLRRVLDQELSRLPHKYRAPVVLCYLEGQTQEEAARRLGCPRKTVTTRLARACARLRQQLTRRGLVLTAAGCAAVLCEEAASAVPSPGLLEVTTRAALLFTTGRPAGAGTVPVEVAALTEGVLTAMTTQARTTTAVLLAVAGLLGTGTIVSAYRIWGVEPASAERARQPEPPRQGAGGAKPPQPLPGATPPTQDPGDDELRKLLKENQAEYTPALAEKIEQDLPRILKARPGETAPGDDDLRKLLKERYHAAVAEMRGRYKVYWCGYAGSNVLVEPAQHLLKAGLELSDKPADQVALLTDYLDMMKSVESVNKARHGGGRIPLVDVEQARYLRLDAEVQLLRAKVRAKGP